jgi:hypothetical protein
MGCRRVLCRTIPTAGLDFGLMVAELSRQYAVRLDTRE